MRIFVESVLLAASFGVFSSIPVVAQSQWTANGSDIYFDGGRVGIGQTAPEEKLDIFGNARVKGTFPYFTLKSTSWDVGSYIQTNLTADGQAFGNYVGFLNPPGKGFSFVQGGPGAVGPILTMHPSGNVGIGQTAPEEKLDIFGNARVKGTFPYFTLKSTSWDVGSYIQTNLTADGQAFGNYVGFLNPPGKGFSFVQGGPGAVGPILTMHPSGNVGIGTTSPQAKLHVDGNIVATTMSMTYQDVAEWVPASKSLAAGTVVIVDEEVDNQVLASSQAYDTRVAGVISGSPGILLGEAGEGKVKVATTGRVKVKVDASRGPIRKGDLLVTSDKEGIAMRSEPIEFAGRRMHQPGTLIGKALQSLEEGEGEILVLLSLQ